jgi:hypothetical protein
MHLQHHTNRGTQTSLIQLQAVDNFVIICALIVVSWDVATTAVV